MLLRFIKNSLVFALFIAIIGMSVMAIYTRQQGGKLLSVQTESMVPVLQKGDLVSVTHVPAKNLHRGDIITFINPRNKLQTITHRIVETPSFTNAQHFVTKGDANPTTDLPIKADAILGKMKYSIPYIGFAADFIRKPIGLALIIYVPALAIVVSEMRRLAAYYKTQQIYRVPGRSHEITKILPLLLLLIFLVSTPAVYALVNAKTTLTKNTIRASRPTPPPPPPASCNTSSNTTTITTTNSTQSSTNVSVNNSVNQSATSGSSSTGNNTTGGNATTGSVSNCSSTTTTITIH